MKKPAGTLIPAGMSLGQVFMCGGSRIPQKPSPFKGEGGTGEARDG